MYALILLAQEAAAPAKDVGPMPNPLTGMVPILIVFALFFFLIVLPGNRRERKQREQLLANLKKNDEVVTNSGIIGIVTSIREGADEVTLKSDETRIRVLRSSIARIVNKEAPKEGA
jgi:preprotein translocase subunit YajC